MAVMVAAVRPANGKLELPLQVTGVEGTLAGSGQPAALLWPRVMLLRADLEAGAGHTDLARDFYTKFLALWSRPDPELAPLVARVRRAISR